MKQKSLIRFTNTYLSVALLACIALWALLFYAFILDEVQDNIEDGLKDQKIQIIRASYTDASVLQIADYGLEQFKIRPIAPVHEDSLGLNKWSYVSYYMEYDQEEEPYLVLTTTFKAADEQTYELAIRTSTVEEDDLVWDLAIGLFALYLLLIGSMIFINFLALRRSWKSFYQLLQQLKNHRMGEDPWKAQAFKVEEFEQLNSSIAFMIDNNEKHVRQQKQFIENASHELQTPIAIAMNQLEHAMQDEQIAERELQNYAQLHQQLQRMAQLNKTLLLISKIENNQYIAKKPIALGELTRSILEEYQELFAHYQIHVQLQITQECVVEMHPELAQLALTNLIRNALLHSPTDSQVEIHIQADLWQIRNRAKSEALNPELIFQRFYKNGSSTQSSGLGLALVQTILKQLPNWKLSYEFEQQSHIFSLRRKNS